MSNRPFILHVVKVKGKRSEHRIGVVVATGPGQVGWSKCNSGHYEDGDGNDISDKFDLNYGIQLALARSANPDLYDGAQVPHKLRKTIEVVAEESVDFFKKRPKV